MRRILMMVLAALLLAGVPVFADDTSGNYAAITAPDAKAGEESLGTEVCPPGVSVEDQRAVTGECLTLSPSQPLIASVPGDEPSMREQSPDEAGVVTESHQAIEPEPAIEPAER